MKKINKMRLGIFLVASLLLFTALLGKQNIGSVDGQVMIENLPEVPNDSYVIPDPCELETVICDYEKQISIKDRIIKQAALNGVDIAEALKVGTCESNLNESARNPDSTAQGIYQFTIGTWEYIGSPGDRLNADDSIAAFMEWYPKYPTWWEQCL